MSHARSQHPNAPLTPRVVGGWSAVCSSMVGRSRRPRSGSRSTRRRCGSGVTGSSPRATTGLLDRSSRGRTFTEPDSAAVRRQVLRLRRKRRWGAITSRIEVGLVVVDGAARSASRGLRPPRSRRPGHRPDTGAALPARTARRVDPRRCEEARRDPRRWWVADHGRGNEAGTRHAKVRLPLPPHRPR